MSTTNFGDFQFGIYMQGMAGQRPALPLNLAELEVRAQGAMDPRAYWYVAGGAGLADTVSSNLSAFAKWQIVPRMLRDVKVRNHRTTILGTEFPAPVMLAPVGVQEIVHRDAERAVARAAAGLGMPMMLSTLSSTPLEEVAQLLGNTPRWFQLYWPGDKAITRSLVQRAEAAGYSAIVVTLDTRSMGWREHDLQEAYLPFLEGKGLANYFSDPVFRSQLAETPEANPQAAILHWVSIYADLTQTWANLAEIREATSLPILLKGILHPGDAKLALEHGMDGIVVSNHGGRQTGGSIGALDALPAIADAVGGKCPILFDSGVRYGADVVKALALGAQAVLLGRPYIWGLAVSGENGVRGVVNHLLADYDLTMGMCGYCSPAELDAGVLVRA